MKCRARMIDGGPVTFEMTDLGLVYELDGGENGYVSDEVFSRRWRLRRPVYLTDCEGEGFSVRCVVPAHVHPDLRAALNRSYLERAGVDTATVEYIESYTQHRPDARMPSDLRPNWVPLFPPVPKHPVLHPFMGVATDTTLKEEPDYKQSSIWLTEKMVQAGCEAWLVAPKDATKKDIVTAIWRAMQWAR